MLNNNDLKDKLENYKNKILMLQNKIKKLNLINNHVHCYMNWSYNYKTGFDESRCECGELKIRKHEHKFTIWEYNPDTDFDESICVCGKVRKKTAVNNQKRIINIVR